LQQEASLGPAGGEHASHVAPQGLQARREPRAIERDRARQRIEGSQPPVEVPPLALLHCEFGEQGLGGLPALDGVE